MSTVKCLLSKMERYEHFRKLSDEQWSDAKEYSKKLDLSEVEAMTYEQIKLFNAKMTYMVDDEVKKKVSEVYHTKRKEKHPEAYGVRYYPELKEIDFLSEEKKELLDECLNRLKIGDYTYLINNKFYGYELRDKIYQFLYEKGIVKKMHGLKCVACGCPSEWIDEEEYNFINTQFGLPYDERDEKFEGWFHVSCMECDDGFVEVDTLEEFEKIKYKVEYKKIKKADTSTDSL